MKAFIVTIPIAGAITIEVEAADKAAAIKAAWELFDQEGKDAGDLTWEAMEHIVEGNVCSAPCNSVECEEA